MAIEYSDESANLRVVYNPFVINHLRVLVGILIGLLLILALIVGFNFLYPSRSTDNFNVMISKPSSATHSA